MVARFECYFSNLHETTLFVFLFVHVLYFNQIQTKRDKQTAVDVKH